MHKIVYLQDFPHHVETCARWAFTTWGQYNKDSSLEKSLSNFAQHLQKNALPLTLLALDQEQPIAMASLRATDGIRPQFQPWLGSLYVEPNYRQQGIGSQLIQEINHKAQTMGYQKIYLLTFDPTLSKWYETLGWILIGQDLYNGHPVAIMKQLL